MGILSNLWTTLSKPFMSVGSQRTLDTQATAMLANWGVNLDVAAIDRYRELYLSNWIARRGINALVRLTLSPLVLRSETPPELAARVNEFNRTIGLSGVLARVLAQYYAYGCSYAEIIGNADTLDASTDITGMHVASTASMRKVLSPYGQVLAFLQMPQALPYVQTAQPIEIDPATMLHVVRDPLGDMAYGVSALGATETEIKQLRLLQDALTKAIVRNGVGKQVFSYAGDPDRESPTEIAETMQAFQNAYETGDIAAPIFVSGFGQFDTKTLSAELNRIKDELTYLVSASISGMDLTPAAMGFLLDAGVSQSAEQRIVLLSMIESVQQQICTELNAKLYSRLADLWNVDNIYVSMEAPVLLSEKERAEKDTIVINNVGLKAKMGVISQQQVAQELGYDAIADEARYEKYIDGPTVQEQGNPADNNQQQQLTKTLNNGGNQNE